MHFIKFYLSFYIIAYKVLWYIIQPFEHDKKYKNKNENNFINCNTAMINTRQRAVIVNAMLEYDMSPLSN